MKERTVNDDLLDATLEQNRLLETYNFHVRKVGRNWVAGCFEFPGLLTHGDTPQKALIEAAGQLEYFIELVATR